MSMEADLVALLKTICAENLSDVASEGTAVPLRTSGDLRRIAAISRRLTDLRSYADQRLGRDAAQSTNQIRQIVRA